MKLPLPKLRNEFAATLSVRRRELVPWNTPTHVFLEVTNRCNLSCVMCGRTHDRRYKDAAFTGDISLATVRKLERFYRPSTFVTATGLGEPFLNPEMVPILRYLKGRGATVSMTSNATVLDDRIARSLVEVQLDRIVFSIDSPDERTFQKIRVGASLDQVLANIERLTRQRAADGGRKPYLILEFVAMAQNFQQLPEVADLAAGLGFDEVIVQNLFKAFDPGYNAFYQRNKLSALDPAEALGLWNDFAARLAGHGIRLYSPFAGGGIQNYLRRGGDDSRRTLKSSGGLLGYIDQPAALDRVGDSCTVSGWALSREGVPRAEVVFENATQTLLRPLRLDRPRPDVLPHLPADFPRQPVCGFSETVDLSELDSGVATLTLRVVTGPEAPPRTLARHQILVRGEEPQRMYCTQPWSTVYVTWDGKVRTCCFHELPLGDLNSQSVEEIWTGENYLRLRRQVAGGEVIPECMDCLAGKSNPNYVRDLKSWFWPKRWRSSVGS